LVLFIGVLLVIQPEFLFLKSKGKPSNSKDFNKLGFLLAALAATTIAAINVVMGHVYDIVSFSDVMTFGAIGNIVSCVIVPFIGLPILLFQSPSQLSFVQWIALIGISITLGIYSGFLVMANRCTSLLFMEIMQYSIHY